MPVSKVSFYDRTLIDLTEDNVTENDLPAGVTAHDAAGNPIVGTKNYATEEWVEEQIGEEARTRSDSDSELSEAIEDLDDKVDNHINNNNIHFTQNEKQAVVEGAQAGSTAVQPDDLAEVAFSGSYNDLIDKPEIIEVEWGNIEGTLSNQTDLQAALDAKANQTTVTTIQNDLNTVKGKIPSEATSANKLADKNFVNSSIATNTANFIGTFNSVEELRAYSGTKTNNDYAFVIVTNTTTGQVDRYDRYKYVASSNNWIYEYTLNNSTFTAAQWATINSGATAEGVELIGEHIEDGDIHVTAAQKTTWSGKQDAIPELEDIKEGAALGATALQPSALNEYRTAADQDDIDDTKASIASLAQVAFSGSYNDLEDKPEIVMDPFFIPNAVSNLTSASTSAQIIAAFGGASKVTEFIEACSSNNREVRLQLELDSYPGVVLGSTGSCQTADFQFSGSHVFGFAAHISNTDLNMQQGITVEPDMLTMLFMEPATGVYAVAYVQNDAMFTTDKVVQSSGDSEDRVMSQAAVTNYVDSTKAELEGKIADASKVLVLPSTVFSCTTSSTYAQILTNFGGVDNISKFISACKSKKTEIRFVNELDSTIEQGIVDNVTWEQSSTTATTAIIGFHIIIADSLAGSSSDLTKERIMAFEISKIAGITWRIESCIQNDYRELGVGEVSFNDLTNRPKYNGSQMTGSTNIPEVKTDEWDAKVDETDFQSHTGNSDIHTSAAEKAIWNSKMSIIKAPGAPTQSTEANVGDLYFDTTNGKLYECTGRTSSDTMTITNGTYTWEIDVSENPELACNNDEALESFLSKHEDCIFEHSEYYSNDMFYVFATGLSSDITYFILGSTNGTDRYSNRLKYTIYSNGDTNASGYVAQRTNPTVRSTQPLGQYGTSFSYRSEDNVFVIDPRKLSGFRVYSGKHSAYVGSFNSQGQFIPNETGIDNGFVISDPFTYIYQWKQIPFSDEIVTDVNWGDIEGTLANQTDLQDALDAKYSKPSSGIPASDLESGVIPTIPVQDVQVNGTSVLGTDGVANVPIGSSSAPGAFKIANDYGTRQTNGFVATYPTNNANIDTRTPVTNPQNYTGKNYMQPVVPANIDYAVKAAMCDGVGAAWSATEKAAAQSRMGVSLPKVWRA